MGKQVLKDTAGGIDELVSSLCDIERTLQSETDHDKQRELSLEADRVRQQIQNLIRGSDFSGPPSKAKQAISESAD